MPNNALDRKSSRKQLMLVYCLLVGHVAMATATCCLVLEQLGSADGIRSSICEKGVSQRVRNCKNVNASKSMEGLHSMLDMQESKR